MASNLSLDVTIDVTSVVDLGEPLHTREPWCCRPKFALDPPVVCFGFPGHGYSWGYYTFDMPDSDDGGEAGWHADRGWIFVACDHLCVGESAVPTNSGTLSIEDLAAFNHATASEVLRILAAGELTPELPAINNPIVLAIGQSMGGCFTIAQQAHHNTFDGIAILGFSAIQVVLWQPAGAHDAGRPTSCATHVPL